MTCESENPRGVSLQGAEPGNQQERPITADWVVGFVDGEGCFSIGVVQQPDRPGRRGYRSGIQISHDFRVPQGARSLNALEELQRFFGTGKIYINRRRDNHREHMYAYSVHKRRDLIDVIIPFFREHPLRTRKREDFEKFARCVEAMKLDSHLTIDGLIEILEIAQTMNRRVSRSDLIGILRGHTPDIRIGE